MQIRLGYELIYQSPQPTPMILTSERSLLAGCGSGSSGCMLTDPCVPLALYRDGFGNWCTRIVAPAGRHPHYCRCNHPRSRAFPNPVVPDAQQHPVETLPEETLVYLLGSRYCETEISPRSPGTCSGNTAPGWARVQAVCDFVHQHITFGYEFARPTKTASEAFQERQGVCRDYAHLAITLCRCLNIPARYCTGYLGRYRRAAGRTRRWTSRAGSRRISAGAGTRSMRATTHRASAAC